MSIIEVLRGETSIDYTTTWGEIFEAARFGSMDATYEEALKQIGTTPIDSARGVVGFEYRLLRPSSWINTANIVSMVLSPLSLQKACLEHGLRLAALWRGPTASLLRVPLLGKTWVDESGSVCVPIMMLTKNRAWSLSIDTGGEDSGLWTPTHTILGVREIHTILSAEKSLTHTREQVMLVHDHHGQASAAGSLPYPVWRFLF